MTSLNNPVIVETQPQYVLVAQALASDIRNVYSVGDLLPSEIQLAVQFGVSRHTVREAMRLLVERGLIRRRRGIGTMVMAREPIGHYTQSTMSVSDLPQYVEETRLEPKKVADIVATDKLSQLLECAQGKRWLHAECYRYIDKDKEPIALTHIYINIAYAGIKEMIGTPKMPVYSLIERQYGEQVAEVKQCIEAQIITSEEAKLLGVDNGSAALKIIRHYYTANGTLMEVAVNLHPAERFSYSMSLRPMLR